MVVRLRWAADLRMAFGKVDVKLVMIIRTATNSINAQFHADDIHLKHDERSSDTRFTAHLVVIVLKHKSTPRPYSQINVSLHGANSQGIIQLYRCSSYPPFFLSLPAHCSRLCNHSRSTVQGSTFVVPVPAYVTQSVSCRDPNEGKDGVNISVSLSPWFTFSFRKLTTDRYFLVP